MKTLVFSTLLFASTFCFAQDLPVAKFYSSKEKDKILIKELIRELDANSKLENTKKQIRKTSTEDSSPTTLLPRQNYPSASKTFYKKTRSKVFCPT